MDDALWEAEKHIAALEAELAAYAQRFGMTNEARRLMVEAPYTPKATVNTSAHD